jgi:hypothetical protein
LRFPSRIAPSHHSSKGRLLDFLNNILRTLIQDEFVRGRSLEGMIHAPKGPSSENINHSLDHFTRWGCQAGYHDRFTTRRNDPQWNHREECKACLDEIKNTPFLIRLSKPPFQGGGQESVRAIRAIQSLILLRTELELLLKNLQLFKRPEFCYAPLHLYAAPSLTADVVCNAISCGIDAVCVREVPLGEAWRCKHQAVPKEWLYNRGTAGILLRKYPSPEYGVFKLPP